MILPVSCSWCVQLFSYLSLVLQIRAPLSATTEFPLANVTPTSPGFPFLNAFTNTLYISRALNFVLLATATVPFFLFALAADLLSPHKRTHTYTIMTTPPSFCIPGCTFESHLSHIHAQATRCSFDIVRGRVIRTLEIAASSSLLVQSFADWLC